ncbi:TetR/AcrR family transcriptional regulator [Streptomyces triticirhizae]|uniref:TetR/AcrR family transcriptional regulator n=1 Tax=Streptomyces triticirhizae TaxID=2483353 RepID=UPI0018F2A46F|nr:TetR/AcrR family transcriptional regulator [Streptomyces triticirhizae]
MGRKGAETRDRLLDATQELVEDAGYFGTGLNQVLAASGAPRGSLYFHFPGGKDQLVAESVRRAGHAVGETLAGRAAEPDMPTTEFVAGVLPALGDRLAQGPPGGDRGAGDGGRQLAALLG